MQLAPRIRTFIVPRLFEAYGGNGHVDHIGALPLVQLLRKPGSIYSLVCKRVIDIAVSGLALILVSPVLAAAAAAVRLETGSDVLFRQIRVGRDGKPFTLLKLCTMRPSSEDESATRWSIAEDNRVGPVGRFLRKTSIDELPQLWNVLRGQMSLVGPRPERPHFVEFFSSTHPTYLHRHRVHVGLTGLAQVNGLRGDTSIADRVRFDNYYIQNWSLWLDFKIMAATVHEVVAGRGR
jgi:exopolysaccharide biosynthesis polyprenyl glycosylphosphotransferase